MAGYRDDTNKGDLAAMAASSASVTEQIILPASNPPVSYAITHIPFADEGGEIRGGAFTVNNDGTMTVNVDMFGCYVNCMVVAEWSNAQNIVLGVGIGDPTQIPTLPGVQVGENYVSRFRDNRKGEAGRNNTLRLADSPVGKNTTDTNIYGLKRGDKIFPVMWASDATPITVNVQDIIFTVQEVLL